MKFLIKSLYAHTYGEDGGDAVEKESSSSVMVVNIGVHQITRSPRHLNRRLGANPRHLFTCAVSTVSHRGNFVRRIDLVTARPERSN
jgi:hypothetical protein